MLMRIVAAGSSNDDWTNDCAARWKMRSGRTELMSFFYVNFAWLAPSLSVLLFATKRYREFREFTVIAEV